MKVTVTLDVEAEDVERLKSAFNDCTEAELQSLLEGHAKASFAEYIELYVGRRVFTRGADLLEHRLALLMQYAFKGGVPTETQVASLFQSNLTVGRSLIRGALSRYGYQLDRIMTASAKGALEKALRVSKSEVTIEIGAASLVERMNRRLSAKSGSLKPITKVSDKIGTYAVGQQSYLFLCDAFGARAVK